jgi:hypothetical protein
MKEVSGSSDAQISALTEELLAAKSDAQEQRRQLAEKSLLLDLGNGCRQDNGMDCDFSLDLFQCACCKAALV